MTLIYDVKVISVILLIAHYFAKHMVKERRISVEQCQRYSMVLKWSY